MNMHNYIPDGSFHYYHYHGMQSMPYRKANNTVHVGQATPAGGISTMPATPNPKTSIELEPAAVIPERVAHYYHYHGMQSMPYRNVASPCT
jgi:hypothetical protein